MRSLRFKRWFFKILMMLVALMLLVMGIGNAALQLVGKPAVAQVTNYEQVLYLNNDESSRNPSRYKVNYQFSVDGQRYTGSVTRVFNGGSHMKETIPVQYLGFRPNINGEDRSDVDLTSLLLVGSGLVLFVLVIKN
ncbi:MAG: hypothetical protein GX829_00680 [Clostridium sp.]|nr:hypothetical protein [Clostridium sp.]